MGERDISNPLNNKGFVNFVLKRSEYKFTPHSTAKPIMPELGSKTELDYIDIQSMYDAYRQGVNKLGTKEGIPSTVFEQLDHGDELTGPKDGILTLEEKYSDENKEVVEAWMTEIGASKLTNDEERGVLIDTDLLNKHMYASQVNDLMGKLPSLTDEVKEAIDTLVQDGKFSVTELNASTGKAAVKDFLKAERIKNPTITTNACSTNRSQTGPMTCIARPDSRFWLY